jgi:hypothetical protein
MDSVARPRQRPPLRRCGHSGDTHRIPQRARDRRAGNPRCLVSGDRRVDQGSWCNARGSGRRGRRSRLLCWCDRQRLGRLQPRSRSRVALARGRCCPLPDRELQGRSRERLCCRLFRRRLGRHAPNRDSSVAKPRGAALAAAAVRRGNVVASFAPPGLVLVPLVSVPLSLPFTLAMFILAWRIWQGPTLAGPPAVTALGGP